MRALRWLFIIVILICLSPILSTLVADSVSRYMGCQIVDVGLGHCVVRGYDIHDLLFYMDSVGVFGIAGLPAAAIACLLWIVAEMIAWTVYRNSKSLKF